MMGDWAPFSGEGQATVRGTLGSMMRVGTSSRGLVLVGGWFAKGKRDGHGRVRGKDERPDVGSCFPQTSQ